MRRASIRPARAFIGGSGGAVNGPEPRPLTTCRPPMRAVQRGPGGIVRCTARAFRRQAALADHRHACGGLANQTNRPVLPPTQQTVSRPTHHHAPHHDDRDPRANVRSQSLSAHRVPKRSRSLTNAIPTITQRSLVRRRWSQQCLHESSQGAICRLTSQLNWRVRYQAVRRKHAADTSRLTRY
jgi:hypothetical protein